MLYDDKPFDGVTGHDRTEVLERQQDAVREEQIAQAEHLTSLSCHPGWMLIRRDMELAIEMGRGMLLTSRTIDHTREWQEFVKARQTLIRWIDAKILEGKTLIKETTQAPE